jgi:hypothetical protein
MVGDAISFVNYAVASCQLSVVPALFPGAGCAEKGQLELMLATHRFLRHDPRSSLLLSRINGDAPQASKI